jgi:hypothetical protein
MRRRAYGLLLVGAAWALPACATRPANLSVYAPPARPGAEQTLAELSRVRNLPVDAPIRIDNVDDATFLRALHAMTHVDPSKTSRDAAFWSAFTMASESADVNAMAQRMEDDNLDGFYDQHAKRLYVRQRSAAEPSSAISDRLTLAHEVEHALQDRFFGIPDVAKIADVDEKLAVRALFEGDATVSSVVLDANRQGTTSAEAIAHIARLQDDDPLLLRASGLKSSSGAPLLLRAEVAWPYVQGSRFVAELAASGGWAMVNAAMRNPPRTTEQVLHIEKYVAGEGPIDVRAPSAPAGYALVETGRMGELRTRFLLAECIGDRGATDAARGWGGDAFAIGSQGSERALLWATVWDDEGAAKRFEAALAARRTCARTGPKPAFVVVRDGTRVAFVQGLADDTNRTVEVTKLLALVGSTPPPITPLGQVELRPRPPVSADFAHGGIVANGKFVDPPIGLATDLDDLRAVKSDALELSAIGQFVTVSAGSAWASPSGALMDSFTASFVEGLRTKIPKATVFSIGTSSVRLSWTMAEARSIRVGNRLTVRIVLAPACQGKMTFILVSSWQEGTLGSTTADKWLKSVKVSESSPACEALKTLRDPMVEAR